MSEPLTAERFDKFETRFDAFVDLYTANHTEIVTTLTDHTKQLDRIEHILCDGQRLAEHERRIIQLAETVGRPDLATPLTRPIGS